MHTGSELVETWTPVGGFKVERRKVRTPDGGATFGECLVPKWEIGDLTPDQPCARQQPQLSLDYRQANAARPRPAFAFDSRAAPPQTARQENAAARSDH